jgi:hypothetical protein
LRYNPGEEERLMTNRKQAARRGDVMLLALALAAVAGCSNSGQAQQQGGGRANMGQDPAMVITSTAFGANQKIPRQYSGEGRDASPPLGWSGVPAQARELALIVDDPDAPRAEAWVHWVIYQMAVTVAGLPEAVLTSEKLTTPPGALQGRNSSGKIGYQGPMPPPGHGVHHYHFKLYALDAALGLKPGADKKALEAAMAGHIVAQAELVGTYER